MFNFLNTSVLFAAAAALIPLLIHLFSKRKVKVIEFSSLKHLKSMQRRQVRRLKIRQLLLLLLRMLLIFMVVLAFARPTTESGQFGSHAPVSSVIIFDNSASMNRYVSDGNLFDLALKRTDNLLDSFNETDLISMILTAPTDDNFNSSSFATAATVKEILSNVSVSNRAGNFDLALNKAVDLISNSSSLNREIYIISDRQSSSLPDSNYFSDLDASVYQLDLPLEFSENCGIVSVDFGGQLVLPGHDFTITARVKNYSGAAKDELIASLFIDGNRVAQTDFQIEADSENSIKFIRSVSSTGFHHGYVEISDDKFTPDNKHYFSFKIPEQSNLLIIDGDNTGQLIQLALTPSDDINHYWSVKTTTPDKLAGIRFWEYDLIFLAGAPVLPEGYFERLESFLKQGKTVLLSYGAGTDPKYFTDNYAKISGLKLIEPHRKDFTRSGYYTFKLLENSHPVFSVFNFEQNKIPEIKFYTLPKFSNENDTETLLTFTGDRPGLVEYLYDAGRVITFTGLISPAYSDLAAHAFFVPFVSRLVEYGASDLSAYDRELYCGQNIIRNLPDQISINRSIELITPSGIYYNLTPGEDSESSNILVRPVEEPGIYRLSFENRLFDMIALNVNPEECDLNRVDNEQFAQALGLEQSNSIPSDVEIAGFVTQNRFGKELWQIFLWIAVVILGIEMILSRGSSAGE